jgi:hypothetical protein
MFHYLETVPTSTVDYRNEVRHTKQTNQNVNSMPMLKADSVFGMETRRHASVTAFSKAQPITPGFISGASKPVIPLFIHSHDKDKTQLEETIRYMQPKPTFRPLQFSIPDFQVGVETRSKTLI